jgi:hypothetical protein
VENRLPIVFPATFLSSSVALMNFRRLLTEAAHLGIAGSEKQETYPAIL